MTYYVYILECWKPHRPSILYTGQTNNINRRLAEHQGGKSRYTSRFIVIRLYHLEEYRTRKEAVKREKQIKKMSKKQKLQLAKLLI